MLQAHVIEALASVHDPELDEPITTLGFVGSCIVSPTGDVDVRLRLPTPQCAPNFAYLMVADARAAVRALPGVGEVTVSLDDHYTAPEINAAVARDAGFDGAFPGETDGDLRALRDLFQRKALLARQGRVCGELLAQGHSAEAVVELRISDLPDSVDARRAIELRRALGLAHDADASALVAGDGTAIPVDGLRMWLRRAQLVGTSLESNGGLCRSLLAVRHGDLSHHQPTEACA
jgi:metal-sulfur cluster biosynthetic enzyme